MAKRNYGPSMKNIQRLQLSMIIGYTLIVLLSIAIVSKLAVRKTDDVLKNKVISMSSSLNVQMNLNMNSYLSRMETIATLAFGEEEAYTYDATDPANDEYEAINTEKVITDKLYSLCIMDNFVDYGIVYRNNRSVGKISNGTVALFGDSIFDALSGMITDTRTGDGWYAGYEGDFKRIYYVKRVHENAVLVISFYANELASVFDNPETLRDMQIRLVNSDYDIIYSNTRDEIGSHLPSDIAVRVQDKSSATVMDNEYMVSVNSCGNDWFVISSIPTKIILNEKNEMRLYIYMVGLMAGVLAALIAVVLSIRLTSPVRTFVAKLDTKASTDQLTGISNKLSFEEAAGFRISSSQLNQPHALIILDLDNFKGVNDTLGHAYGDMVLAKTGSILRATFSLGDFLGRIGGDEFAVLVNSVPDEGVPYEEYIRIKCEELCKAFSDNYTGDDGDYKISASVGAALFPAAGSDYIQLYRAADQALYHSKRKGKDTYTFYNESMSDEEVKH